MKINRMFYLDHYDFISNNYSISFNTNIIFDMIVTGVVINVHLL